MPLTDSPNTPFWDCPELKEAADNNWNVAIKGFYNTDCIENIVENGEIAHLEQFHLFPQCFPKAVFFNVVKWVYMEERVKQDLIRWEWLTIFIEFFYQYHV